MSKNIPAAPTLFNNKKLDGYTRVLLWLIANTEQKTRVIESNGWEVELQPGQVLASSRDISAETGVKRRSVRDYTDKILKGGIYAQFPAQIKRQGRGRNPLVFQSHPDLAKMIRADIPPKSISIRADIPPKSNEEYQGVMDFAKNLTPQKSPANNQLAPSALFFKKVISASDEAKVISACNKPANNKQASFSSSSLPLPEHLDTEISRQSLEKWFAYKKEQFRFRYKPMGLSSFLTKLGNEFVSDKDLAEAIEHSIAEGYKGVFRPNRNGGSSRQLIDRKAQNRANNRKLVQEILSRND